MALLTIINGTIGASGRGKSPIDREIMLGMRPTIIPAWDPKKIVDKNKVALTIGPVTICCFNNGAKVAIRMKVINWVKMRTLLLMAKVLVLIMD